MTDTKSDIEFAEHVVEADGFRIRYAVAGDGPAVICLHGAGGMRVQKSHGMLAARHRVFVMELPGFGTSPANERTGSMREMAETVLAAATALGLESYSVSANSFSARTGLWMAALAPDAVTSVALIAPSAIRLDGAAAAGPDVDMASLLYAHPERFPPLPRPDPAVDEKQWALVRRLRGPARDAEMEAALADSTVPVIALFGTADRINPPEAAPLYCGFLKNCHLMMVYDAAHLADIERPEAVVEAVADFFARQAKFLVRERSDLILP